MSTRQDTLELSISLGGASFSASGETSVVLGAYADFKSLIGQRADPIHEKPTNRREDAEGSTSTASDGVRSTTSLPLKPYLAQCTLRGNKEKATAILAWLASSDQQAALKLTEIEDLWRKTGLKPPSNLARDLAAAESEGWIDAQGKARSPVRTYSINGYGEGIVAGWKTKKE
jgi:hypothetical protein